MTTKRRLHRKSDPSALGSQRGDAPAQRLLPIIPGLYAPDVYSVEADARRHGWILQRTREPTGWALVDGSETHLRIRFEHRRFERVAEHWYKLRERL